MQINKRIAVLVMALTLTGAGIWGLTKSPNVLAEEIFVPIINVGEEVVAHVAAVAMAAGETLTVSCTGGSLSAQQIDLATVLLSCVGATPVPPTATVPPATNTPAPATATTPPHSMADMHWHAPGAHGDRPFHEHGDAPPAWLTATGVNPSYDHVGGTPNENHAYFKHTGFKGWAGTFSGVQWYGVFHLDFNPGGHGNRFHSYQLWLRDSTGAISHMNGWLDFGQDNNTGPNLVVDCGTTSQVRPIISVNGIGCPIIFESWYANSSSPGPDFGFNINPNYYAGGDPANPATWTNTGYVRNLNRRIEFAYYGKWGDENLRGEFWTTQFGNVVSGPNDPSCGTSVTIGTRTYTIVCLRQFIAPSLPNVQFPGNAVQRTFAGANVVLPN